MTSCAEVERWIVGAAQKYGDPSKPVCQLFFRWQDLQRGDLLGPDLACGFVDGQVMLLCGPDIPPLPVTIVHGAPQVTARRQLLAYGATRIAPGVWSVAPSLNVAGVIHGFVVLYDVPDPAPWTRMVVLP